MIVEKLRLILKETAEQEARLDREDFNVSEEVGGDIDGAFALGTVEGQIAFSRQLIGILDLLVEQEEGLHLG